VSLPDMSGDWPHQQKAVHSLLREWSDGTRSVCVTLPTGMGKTRVFVRVMEWAAKHGHVTRLYSPRRMLTEQIYETLKGEGLRVGVRAAGWEEHFDPEATLQLASIQTEISRQNRLDYQMLPPQLILVDEWHLFQGDEFGGHIDNFPDAKVAGLTATPLGVNRSDSLIVAGQTSDGFQCGALIPAKYYSPTTPELTRDVRKVAARDCVDLFGFDGYAQQVCGHVIANYNRLNPERYPTLLFAPSVDSSKWMVDHLEANGITAAHIDGECTYWNKEEENDKERRQEILSALKEGRINVVCNRFVLREGIDLPEVMHLILATPIPSIQAFIQVCGRVIRRNRNRPDLEHVVIQDHGGNDLLHGISPNDDLGWFWQRFWKLDENKASSFVKEAIRNSELPEPIVCPNCQAVRRSGKKCQQCGFQHQKRTRPILQTDGKLTLARGKLRRPRKVDTRPEAYKKWESLFWGCRKSKKKPVTFAQMRGIYIKANGFEPPPDAPYMPVCEADWNSRVKELDFSLMTRRER